ncbi:MAG TPA: hypothetical protein VN328_09680 [Thermodesulfovibrionales bacterium]|nr:hypothetical protein [Thermodesulfovibrionales bacterium]
MATLAGNDDDFPVPQWIKPINEIPGRDHLGVQAISINLYGQLLPGITNLTQRIRYYSVYPWLLHHYAKRVGIRNREKWIQFLRKAEFLYALSCLSSNPSEVAVIGQRKASKLLSKVEDENKTFTFSDYADYKSPASIRYFQNKSGGYGQYYFVAIESVDILSYPEDDKMENLTPLGSKLAGALDQVIPSSIIENFFASVEQGKVKKADLPKFGEFLGLSRMNPQSQETEILKKRLFEGDVFSGFENVDRRESLLLFLSIADQLAGKGNLDVQNVRDILYTRYLPNGRPLKIATQLQDAVEKWRCYLIGEYIHVALEVLFSAVLDLLAGWDKGLPTVNDLVQDSIARTTGSDGPRALWRRGELKKKTWADLSAKMLRNASSDKDWADDKMISPRSLSMKMLEQSKEGSSGKAMSSALGLIALIMEKHRSEKCLREMYGASGRMGRNFPEFNPLIIFKILSRMSNETCDKILFMALKKFIIEKHIRVALTKLRYQNKGTFKFVLEDGRLHWIDSITPTFTNPRLFSALQCLQDLKLTQLHPCKITPSGKLILQDLLK